MTYSETWIPFEEGHTIGTDGTERGMIRNDEEYDGFARITIEENTSIAPFAITCGVYGWFVHTVFCKTEAEVRATYERMKKDLVQIVDLIPGEKDFERLEGVIIDAIHNFVKRYP